MVLEEKVKIDLSSRPYYVLTRDEEKFYVAKSLCIINEKSFNVEFDDEIDELILNKDIKEENTRGLNLLVQYNESNLNKNKLLAIFNECKKFTRLCLCDYFSIELIHGSFLDEVLIPGYSRVQPRLFRKIIDN